MMGNGEEGVKADLEEFRMFSAVSCEVLLVSAQTA
jgi:hypothetical protein